MTLRQLHIDLTKVTDRGGRPIGATIPVETEAAVGALLVELADTRRRHPDDDQMATLLWCRIISAMAGLVEPYADFAAWYNELIHYKHECVTQRERTGELPPAGWEQRTIAWLDDLVRLAQLSPDWERRAELGAGAFRAIYGDATQQTHCH